jgi:cell division protein FtsI (penicillin-binding protein 3)
MQPTTPRLSAEKQQVSHPLQRVRLWYAALILVAGLFIIRAFYVQIIRHNYYKQAAISSQLKEYQIPAERGVIEAFDGENVVPIVLNETKYTLFADPEYIDDPKSAAEKIAAAVGGKASDYQEAMEQETRYAILAKKMSLEQKEAVDKLDILGVGTRETPVRVYPQSSLAAQALGFVDDEGAGKYGIEQYLDKELAGKPGQLKAITDANGVPLVTNKDNIVEEPQNGKRVLLTLDVSMQQQLQDILRDGLKRAQSNSGSAVIMDPKTGDVKAMANYPTYNPAEFFKVEDANVFTNDAVSAPFEVGSIMKPLTTAAALETGSVTRDQTYYDPGFFKIDDATVENVEEVRGAAQRSVQNILTYSLNTGATWLLMQMGGGEVNEKARNTWHDFMSNRYRFGKTTGIEQGYESAGTIPDPNEGFGLNITYANTSFGQAMTATPLQMAAAISSVVNGGTYYKPRLVAQVRSDQDEVKQLAPQKLNENVVSDSVGKNIREMMAIVAETNNPTSTRSGYVVGGKTGTAQIARPEGGYYDDRYNGTYMGFVGGDQTEYVIVVRVNEPRIPGYAGSQAAAPIFSRITNMLIDNFGVPAKTN